MSTAGMATGEARAGGVRKALEAVLDERGLIVAGYAVIVGFVALFFLWGGTVPLASAAIAPGTVGIEGDKKTIQHADGGVVEAIRAREGARVERGDVLVVLDDTAVRARHDELDEQWIELAVEVARREAELDDRESLVLPDALLHHPRGERVSAAVADQERLLRTRAAVLAESRARLERALDVIAEESATNEGLITNLLERRRLVEAELAEYRALAANGLATRAQLFDLDKERADIVGDLDAARGAIAVGERRRAEIAAQLAELASVSRNEAAEGASRARRLLDTLSQQLVAARGELRDREIRAPVAGFVTNSAVNTIGGVIRPGEPIMQIVPSGERLMVESRVDPKDRDAVRTGQQAEVRFSAFDRRSTPPLPGRVVLISADRLTDAVTQTPYYRTLVALDADARALPGGAEIHPGMQAEVLIATGEQTLLDYLLAPLVRSFDRALRED